MYVRVSGVEALESYMSGVQVLASNSQHLINVWHTCMVFGGKPCGGGEETSFWRRALYIKKKHTCMYGRGFGGEPCGGGGEEGQLAAE